MCPKQIVPNTTNIIHDYTYSSLGPIWDLYKTVPLFLGLLIFPFLNFNNPTFFTKFNSLGKYEPLVSPTNYYTDRLPILYIFRLRRNYTYLTGTASIMYIIVFVIMKSASWGINMDEIEWEISWTLKSSFPALSGTLAMSFFIHNIIITVMQNNRDQTKNVSSILS